VTRQPPRRRSPGTAQSPNPTPSRGSAPVAVVILVGLAVVLAAGVGAALTGSGPTALQSQPRYVTIDGEATADGTVTLTHSGGGALDIRRLDVSVTADGESLTHQPPIPFFSASGFYSGPRGPFNAAADPAWTAGEVAGFSIAGTNDPPLLPGSEVVVTLMIGSQTVARIEMVVTVG